MKKNNENKTQKMGVKISALVLAVTLNMGVSSIAIADTLPISTGSTTTAAGTTPELAVPEYTLAELKTANCDPNVWSTLVTNYLKKRGFERQVQGQIQVRDQANAAPSAKSASSGGSCWENALGSLKDGAKSIDSLLSIFTGGVNWDAIADKVMNQVSDYACSQLNNYVGQINYGIRSQVGNVTGGLNDTLGQIGVKGPVVNIDGTDIIRNPSTPNTGNGPVSGAFDNAISILK